MNDIGLLLAAAIMVATLIYSPGLALVVLVAGFVMALGDGAEA